MNEEKRNQLNFMTETGLEAAQSGVLQWPKKKELSTKVILRKISLSLSK